MTWEIAFVLFLIAGALVVFAKELLPIEVTAIGMTTILLVVCPLTTARRSQISSPRCHRPPLSCWANRSNTRSR